MYKIVTFGLFWVSDFTRAWFITSTDTYANIAEIAKHYGQNTWRLGYLYKAAYKKVPVKDSVTRCFLKTYWQEPPKNFTSPYWRYYGHEDREKIVVYREDGVPIHMVTIYMAAIEHFKKLPRDVHGRIINHRRWRHRSHNSTQMRWPTTFKELRQNDSLDSDRADLEEIGYPKHRLKARKRWLPTAYDDLVTTRGNNWKTHRKSQYRVKN